MFFPREKLFAFSELSNKHSEVWWRICLCSCFFYMTSGLTFSESEHRCVSYVLYVVNSTEMTLSTLWPNIKLLYFMIQSSNINSRGSSFSAVFLQRMANINKEERSLWQRWHILIFLHPALALMEHPDVLLNRTRQEKDWGNGGKSLLYFCLPKSIFKS